MERIRFRFQIALIALFTAMIVGTALGLVLVETGGAERIERDSALAFMDVVGDRAADHVSALLEPVGTTLRVIATRPALLESTAPTDADIVPALAQSLVLLPGVYGLLLGYEDGNYIHLESLAAMPEQARIGEHAPPEAAFRLTEIHRQGTQRVQKQVWLDAAAMPLGNAFATPSPAFDPRQRPWYRDLPAGAAVAMTKLYVFFTLHVPGYTVSVPVSGKVHGVLAADILLSSLDEFLKAQRISPGARVVLFDETGAVASAGGLSDLLRDQPRRAGGDELVPPRLAVLRYPALDAAVAQWRAHGGTHETVTVAGRRYIASLRRVASPLANGLHVITIAPLDEFFGAIERLRLRILLYALGITAAAVLLALEIGCRITRRLGALADEARKIRRFELEPSPAIRSRLIEIDQLAESLARAKSAVRDFARFVPRSLVRQLIETGATLELGGERREVTLLFSDAVGFTALSEKADPAELMRNASRYLAALSTAIARHGGTIDKYIGDSIMAFWNAPAAEADHVARACAAALACREANAALNRQFAQEGWPAMRTRYGLHVGEVIVGNIGSEDRMNYTAVGAAVNLASRLEALNTRYGTEILASEAVAARAGDRFLFRRVDHVLPKGITEPVTIYALIGPAGAADPALHDRLELWAQVIAAWEARRWGEALRRITAYLRLDPADAVAREYRDRCVAFLREPPSVERALVTLHEDK